MIYLKNNTETQAIYIPRQTVLGGGYIATTKTYEDGYRDGLKDGKEQQKDKLLNLYVTENGQYEREDGWGVVTVDVHTDGGDCSDAYNQGYNDGYNQGQAECPDCPELTEIAITENGRYEGAYNVVNVDVPTEGGSCNLGAGVKEISENGSYNYSASDDGFDGYSSIEVRVNVPQSGEGGGCNLEDKWVTPSMSDRDDNNLIVVEESEGYDGLSRVVIDPQTIYNEGVEAGRAEGGGSCNLEDKIVSPTVEEIDNGWLYVNPSEGYNGMSRVVVGTSSLRDSWYNEGVEAGRAEGGEGGSCNLGVLDWTLTSPYSEQKNASDDGYDGYSAVVVRPDNMIAQVKEYAINDFKNKMDEITITENGSYSIYEKETVNSITFDGNSYFDTGIVPTENIKIEVCIKVTNGNDSGAGGIIIGGGIGPVDLGNSNSTENRGIAIGMGGGAIYGVWGAIKSGNNPYKYEGEGTTTVVLQKTDDSWLWEGEKGSFGASTLYIGGYNKNGEEVEEKFTQSIVYIKIWTNKDDDSTLITYTPKTNGNFDANGVELQRLGDGTTTFVEENLDKYPNGFKSIEVNVVSSAIDGMKFGNSTFEECPFNLEAIEDFSYLFENCKNLRTAPSIQKPIRNARSMFSGCSSLTTAPLYNTSEATDLGGMYAGCHNLTSVGAVDCSSLPNSPVGWNREAEIFDTNQYPSLTDFGGFINLKQTVDLSGLIALSSNSVESIFNNLYDFRGNGETPNEIQGKITMSSFVTDAVEQYRSTTESKGWTITIK